MVETVSGDVAVLGGTVIQKRMQIVGAVIIIGGAYQPETVSPKRGPNAETVVFGMFEEEFRQMAEQPSTILAPNLTAFLYPKGFSAFWFIVTLIFVTIAPGPSIVLSTG